jgi:hypothetical protein
MGSINERMFGNSLNSPYSRLVLADLEDFNFVALLAFNIVDSPAFIQRDFTTLNILRFTLCTLCGHGF